ncbi:DUF2283 domain-containing protein [Leifsonia sp. NPDC058230]|uniref:DUF2283 domain-containing protein n=1 Tax=Leifsonia sp. NPDC058230 TaxID=3346391 RepID=UPI0036DCACDD
MRLIYDAELDVAYLRVDDDAQTALPAHSGEAATPAGGAYVSAEYDADGYFVGVEILGAHRVLSPAVLADAERLARP